jgi:hypothetical protein
VAEARRAEPLDLDHLVLGKPGHELASSVVVPSDEEAPALARVVRKLLEQAQQLALRVAPDEERVERPHELERLFGQRPPREVAADDDKVRFLPPDLVQDRLERGRVAVDVGERRDSRGARPQPAFRIARISSHLPILERPAMFFSLASS